MRSLLIPDDDLYARLELPSDASPEAIELAWRSLLRRHHPDVDQDPAALDRAKRINVAHDWLGDPDLRARYDRERLGVRARGFRPRHAHSAPPTRAVPGRRPEPSPAERLEQFLDRVARLTTDELDRLSLAEPPPIAFLATLRRFLEPADLSRLERVDAELARRMPARGWADLPTREAVRGVAAELVLGATLDDLLAEPFRTRARERLLRAWEASLDQPRYGPNTEAILALRDEVGRLEAGAIRAFLRASTGIAAADRPWPARLDAEDDEGLRVSAALADRDVQDAARSRTGNVRAQRLLGRVAHVVALRHAFGRGELDRLLAGWRAAERSW